MACIIMCASPLVHKAPELYVSFNINGHYELETAHRQLTVACSRATVNRMADIAD